MPDGKQWTMDNLNVKTDPSYCYDDTGAELPSIYGRLYIRGNRRSRDVGITRGWLATPTTDDWTQLAKHYGGVRGDSGWRRSCGLQGALERRGSSGFNALLGGGRSEKGEYARLGGRTDSTGPHPERSGHCVVLQLWQGWAGAQSSEGRRTGTSSQL